MYLMHTRGYVAVITFVGFPNEGRIPRRNHLMGDWLFHFLVRYIWGKNTFLCHFHDIFYLLIALVAYGEPTPSNYYMHDAVRPNGAFLGDSWQKHCETRFPPLDGFLFALYPFCF